MLGSLRRRAGFRRFCPARQFGRQHVEQDCQGRGRRIGLDARHRLAQSIKRHSGLQGKRCGNRGVPRHRFQRGACPAYLQEDFGGRASVGMEADRAVARELAVIEELHAQRFAPVGQPASSH